MKQCKLNLFPECPGYCPSGAVFTPDKQYRYHLWRRWGDGGAVMFIGLNPSTANENTDDPTIRRLVGFAKRWGYGSINMYNLFGLVSAYPEALSKSEKPISHNQNDESEMCHNDRYLIDGIYTSDLVVCCWGSWKLPIINQRAKEVVDELKDQMWGNKKVMCFGLNKDGNPKHPLYLRSDTELVKFI